jgi:hypothetical protein
LEGGKYYVDVCGGFGSLPDVVGEPGEASDEGGEEEWFKKV